MPPTDRRTRRPFLLALWGAAAACSTEPARTTDRASNSGDRVQADERAVRSADSALQAAIVAKDAERTAARTRPR
jgi:hypothetical protein